MTTVNITVQNDADFYRMFAVETTAGDPVDITGGTLEMKLRRDAADETAVLRIGTSTGEMVILDGVNGRFSVRIAQATLARLAVGDYAQSNVMTRGGYKLLLWNGLLTNKPGPTR